MGACLKGYAHSAGYLDRGGEVVLDRYGISGPETSTGRRSPSRRRDETAFSGEDSPSEGFSFRPGRRVPWEPRNRRAGLRLTILWKRRWRPAKAAPNTPSFSIPPARVPAPRSKRVSKAENFFMIFPLSDNCRASQGHGQNPDLGNACSVLADPEGGEHGIGRRAGETTRSAFFRFSPTTWLRGPRPRGQTRNRCGRGNPWGRRAGLAGHGVRVS